MTQRLILAYFNKKKKNLDKLGSTDSDPTNFGSPLVIRNKPSPLHKTKYSSLSKPSQLQENIYTMSHTSAIQNYNRSLLLPIRHEETVAPPPYFSRRTATLPQRMGQASASVP